MSEAKVKSGARQVRSIIIVGGGSSGWITACLLNAKLNDGHQKTIKITLIEAPGIPVIGVGEATVPSIRRTLQAIGIPEIDFMRGADATFKSLIRFENWNAGEHFDHPFDRRDRPGSDLAVLSWLFHDGKSGEDFANRFSVLSNTSTRMLAPKALGWPAYQSTFPYAYHLDAVKLGQLLTTFGTAKGIAHKWAKIENVEIDETGDIAGLVSDSGKTHTADLYIDCTGFAAKLAGHVMPQTQDYSRHLLCNRAATMSVPYDTYRPDHILPYTSANARSAGWIWDINLKSRRSLGYVYSDQHISPKDAERELRKVEGLHARDIPIRHIRFKTYKRKKSWWRNCVAIGLSDGFVEPLESTGLYMMQFAAQSLADILRFNASYSPDTASQFNHLSQCLYDEILGFVALHYLTSKRRDTQFWCDATDVKRTPEHLKHLLEEWKSRPPHDMDMLSNHRLFSLESYEYLLFGMGYVSRPARQMPSMHFSLKETLDKCYAKLPLHEYWLDKSLER